MSYAVIQGSSKGIGQAIARHLLSKTKLNVVATTSSGSSAAREDILKPLSGTASDAEGRLTVLDMDVTDESAIRSASKDIEEKFGQNLRLLTNLSGMLHAEKSLADIDAQKLLRSFQVNTFGHLLVAKHFVHLIPKRKKDGESIFESDSDDTSSGILPNDSATIVNFSARVGSITDNKGGGWYSYRASKAALTQVTRSLAFELKARKYPASAFAYHPGTVKTGLSASIVGDKEADESKGILEPEQAAEKFIGVLKSRVANGSFVDWKGETVPW